MPEAAATVGTTSADRRRLAAIFWLGVTCVCWGWSFSAMPMATKVLVPRVPDTPWALLAVVTTFTAWRFWLAAILYAGLNRLPPSRYTRADLTGGVAVGVTFSGGLFLQMAGLRYALPSVSGFITSMSVVLLPLIQAYWLRRPPRSTMWLAVGLALMGLSVFGLSPEPAQAEPPFRLCGELLTLCGTLFFTGQILCVDRFGSRADPTRLTIVMFLTTAIVATLVSLVTPGGATLWGRAGIRALGQEPELQLALLSTAVVSSALAFHLMNRFQPRVTPAMAGIIYCLEPIFATLWSLGLGMEGLRWNLAGGGGCILLALAIASCTRPSEPR